MNFIFLAPFFWKAFEQIFLIRGNVRRLLGCHFCRSLHNSNRIADRNDDDDDDDDDDDYDDDGSESLQT